jgi:lipopolysaccharide transport system ATP-binding protein
MGDAAIRVEGLGKEYRVGELRRGLNLRETIAAGARSAVRRLASRGEGGRGGERFWALRDVSFEVRPGEAVGIIGGNGAGKSTLLKILSRITEPTQGDAWIHGRVGSLLEVGTGFHLELTGRENTYLNGAILGMKRREIDRRFDEIVDFSGVERFIDTPVKQYSTGMYLRLAFAVAAHLEPEVLIVDEVLAVGDAAFQQKCLGKMSGVAREGRTVLFVSHNMAAVQTLCSRALLLRAGRLECGGPVGEVVARYLHSVERAAGQSLAERTDRSGRGEVRLAEVEVSTGGPLPSTVLSVGRTATFAFRLDGRHPGTALRFTVRDQLGQPVTSFHTVLPTGADPDDADAEPRLACEVPELPLVPGSYRVDVEVRTDGELQDRVEGAALFQVAEGVLRGEAVSADGGEGSVRLRHRWLLPSGAVAG